MISLLSKGLSRVFSPTVQKLFVNAHSVKEMVTKARGQEEKEGSEQYRLEDTLLFGGLEGSLKEVTFILNWKNNLSTWFSFSTLAWLWM